MRLPGAALPGIALALMASCGTILSAQTAPTAYTVTVVNSLMGTAQQMTTYRLGDKALVDQLAADKAKDPTAQHTRSYYDLVGHRNFSWYVPTAADAGCGSGTFSGDWGDPFTGASDLTGPDAKQAGTEMLHGILGTIYEASASGTTIKAWVDPKTGLVLKAQIAQGGAPLKTILEVTSVSFAPPPASVFVIPPVCAAAFAAPPPPTEEEKLAALTGSDGKDFVRIESTTATTGSCAVLFKVVKAGTMEPITHGFQVAADLLVATEGTPSYVFGVGGPGPATFKGGGIHEVTSQLRNGVLRLDNAPAKFALAVDFGSNGSADADMIYRQCYAPQTVLLLVVKDTAKISDGADWIWVKSGKYTAGH
jgi:hypothetical protein